MNKLLYIFFVFFFFQGCDSIEKKYYPDGVISEKIIKSKNDSIIYKFDRNGNQIESLHFLNGKLEGNYEKWDYISKDSVIYFLWQYKNGLLEGKNKMFINNNLFKEVEMVDGKKEGAFIEYYPHLKKIKVEGKYRNNNKEGLFKIFNEKSKLVNLSEYRNDNILYQIFYNSKGICIGFEKHIYCEIYNDSLHIITGKISPYVKDYDQNAMVLVYNKDSIVTFEKFLTISNVDTILSIPKIINETYNYIEIIYNYNYSEDSISVFKITR